MWQDSGQKVWDSGAPQITMIYEMHQDFLLNQDELHFQDWAEISHK